MTTCLEDYVRISNDDQGGWTFCETCPRQRYHDTNKGVGEINGE